MIFEYCKHNTWLVFFRRVLFLNKFFKGSIPSVGSKHQLIQFRVFSFIYLLSLKVRQQPEQKLLASSKSHSKQDTNFVYSLFVTFLCTHVTLQRLLGRLLKLMYKTIRLCLKFALEFSAHYWLLLVRWCGWVFERSALFSSLYLGVDSRLFCWNLIILENAYVLLHYSSCKLYNTFWKKKLLACSNYYFRKIFFVVFNYLEIRLILHYAIYRSFVDYVHQSHRQQIHKSNFSLWVAFNNCL